MAQIHWDSGDFLEMPDDELSYALRLREQVRPVQYELWTGGAWKPRTAPSCTAAIAALKPGEWLRWDGTTEDRWCEEPAPAPDDVHWEAQEDNFEYYTRRPPQ